MRIELPADCGNAPRIEIVGEFISNWAAGDAGAVSERLAHDVTWTLVGESSHHGIAAASETSPPFVPEQLTVTSIITHGRLASCDGHLIGDGKRIDFSHAIRFASTSKTAKIAELRSYCIETQHSA